MESRYRRALLKSPALLLLAGLAASPCVQAKEGIANLDQGAFEPNVLRMDTEEPRVKARDIELGVHIGELATGDFGTNPVIGFNAIYHANEDVFYELDTGRSQTQTTSAERLSSSTGLVLDGSGLTYAHLLAGLDLIQGQMSTGSRSYNTVGYVMGGGGVTQLFGDNAFTWCFGAGMRMMMGDGWLLHVDALDYRYNSNALVVSKTYNDIEVRAGLTTLF